MNTEAKACLPTAEQLALLSIATRTRGLSENDPRLFSACFLRVDDELSEAHLYVPELEEVTAILADEIKRRLDLWPEVLAALRGLVEIGEYLCCVDGNIEDYPHGADGPLPVARKVLDKAEGRS